MTPYLPFGILNLMEDESTFLNIQSIAINLFATRGYEAVGVQEICNKAGIKKPTLYYHFGSKSGLLSQIAQSKGQELLNTITEAASYEHDFIKSLTQLLKAEINFAQENPDFYRLHSVLYNAPSQSESKQLYQPLLDKIRDCYQNFFLQSTKEIGNMKDKEALYSLLFQNNVISVVTNLLNNNLQATDQTIHQIIHSFIYGVVA